MNVPAATKSVTIKKETGCVLSSDWIIVSAWKTLTREMNIQNTHHGNFLKCQDVYFSPQVENNITDFCLWASTCMFQSNLPRESSNWCFYLDHPVVYYQSELLTIVQFLRWKLRAKWNIFSMFSMSGSICQSFNVWLNVNA